MPSCCGDHGEIVCSPLTAHNDISVLPMVTQSYRPLAGHACTAVPTYTPPLYCLKHAMYRLGFNCHSKCSGFKLCANCSPSGQSAAVNLALSSIKIPWPGRMSAGSAKCNTRSISMSAASAKATQHEYQAYSTQQEGIVTLFLGRQDV